MNKKITALAFAGFAALALSACSGNKAPTEERTGAAGSARQTGRLSKRRQLPQHSHAGAHQRAQ
jgi:hypothetical protein